MRDHRYEEMMRKARAKALKSAEEMTDEEDAQLTAAALRDPDNPPLDDERAARLRPAIDVHPELVADYLARRGPLCRCRAGEGI